MIWTQDGQTLRVQSPADGGEVSMTCQLKQVYALREDDELFAGMRHVSEACLPYVRERCLKLIATLLAGRPGLAPEQVNRLGVIAAMAGADELRTLESARTAAVRLNNGLSQTIESRYLRRG